MNQEEIAKRICNSFFVGLPYLTEAPKFTEEESWARNKEYFMARAKNYLEVRDILGVDEKVIDALLDKIKEKDAEIDSLTKRLDFLLCGTNDECVSFLKGKSG